MAERKCGYCGGYGHNARTCPKKAEDAELAKEVGKDNPTAPDAGTMGGDNAPAISPPATPPMPEKKMSQKEEELVSLIGLDATLKLKELGLIEKTTIEETKKTNLKVINGRYEDPFRIEYGDGKNDRISKIILNSNMTEKPSSSTFNPDAMGDSLSSFLNELLQSQISVDTKVERVKYLREMIKHMDSLSKVFGFDDQRQLEAFFAAWLMQNSTCRLTGIPGTGKTTVIESAATLLANSYGFNSFTRVLLDTSQYKNYRKGSKVVPIIFPNGMNYALDYGNNEALRGTWESWRFTDWNKKSKVSGAYLYDFTFLQRLRGNKAKEPLTPIKFAETLFASLNTNTITDKATNLTTTTYDIKSTPITRVELSKLFKNDKLPSTINSVKKNDVEVLQYQGKDLYKDAGGNEGFYLRRFLMDYFYDARIDDEKNGLAFISKEMLEEIGIAKIDYDKRAEEILYGIEIRQETSTNKVTGNTVSEYKFDPAPRPIVTQPIKFFNEANRSGSGVEDAVLGLIAERTVEYRGQTFTSPSFVAWMDTNPHQKGNDLAFVDRIDMELYFGTLTLGARFNALTERYSQRKGSDPKIQLIRRIMTAPTSSDHIRPMRFAELRNVWDLSNGIFFNASGKADTEGGALLDISLLSVLFTQRYMPKSDTVNVKYNNQETAHTYADSSHTYFSPLVDISRTTNLQYEKQHEDEINKYLAQGSAQAPALIERMLGFRFTNSMIKMTRALAFLRGKDFVTRQEVIDSLPYCVGHRLGPAREGEDPKGRDIGINRDSMTLTNEQEWIKELILDGYVMKTTNSLMGNASQITLFDDWDSFMKKCKNTIEANDESWIYERDILDNMKSMITSGSGITPVHWHIATMIVENVRNSKKYQENYKNLFEKISRPQSIEGDEKDMTSEAKAKQISASKSLYQYYAVRGRIINDEMLFSDDKYRLLELINSKIQSLAGIRLPETQAFKGTTYPTAISNYGKMTAFYQSKGFEATDSYGWGMYNDGLGGWCYMASNGKNKPPQISLGGANANVLGEASYIYEANQEMAIVGGFYPVQNPSDFTIPEKFSRRVDSLVESLKGSVKNGIIFNYNKGSLNIQDTAAKLETFKTSMKASLTGYLSENGTMLADLEQGLFGCFEIEHNKKGDYTPNEMIKGEDNVLLWLRLHLRQGKGTQVGEMAYIGLEIGITSKPAESVATSKRKMKNPDGSDYEQFTEYNYCELEQIINKVNYQSPTSLIDSGNLTESDANYYINQILKSISNE